MPAPIYVYHLHRRFGADAPVLLGYFTDEGMAEQARTSLYRIMWQDAQNSMPVYLTSEQRDLIMQQGIETWAANDRLSPDPMFFFAKSRVWNHLPAIDPFTLVFSDNG